MDHPEARNSRPPAFIHNQRAPHVASFGSFRLLNSTPTKPERWSLRRPQATSRSGSLCLRQLSHKHTNTMLHTASGPRLAETRAGDYLLSQAAFGQHDRARSTPTAADETAFLFACFTPDLCSRAKHARGRAIRTSGHGIQAILRPQVCHRTFSK